MLSVIKRVACLPNAPKQSPQSPPDDWLCAWPIPFVPANCGNNLCSKKTYSGWRLIVRRNKFNCRNIRIWNVQTVALDPNRVISASALPSLVGFPKFKYWACVCPCRLNICQEHKKESVTGDVCEKFIIWNSPPFATLYLVQRAFIDAIYISNVFLNV